MALLVLPKGWLCVGAKPNVPLVRLAENFKIFCAVGKKLKHRRVGKECRLTRCPNVVSFLCRWSPVKMVYFFLVYSRLFVVARSSLHLLVTFSGLAKVAIFTTNVDAENQTLITHYSVCGALDRHFCQTRVSTSPFFSVVFVRCHFSLSVVRWLGGSFAFFVWLCADAKKQMCHQMRWLLSVK